MSVRIFWLVCCGVGVLLLVLDVLSIFSQYRAGSVSGCLAGAAVALFSFFMYRRAAGKK